MYSSHGRILGFLALFTIMVMLTYSPFYEKNQIFLPQFKKTDQLRLSIIDRPKVILSLTSQLWGFRFNMGRMGFINAGCEVSNCVLTVNRSYVEGYNFDAFLIHTPTERKGPWNPPNRRKNQIFILFSTEPPDHMPPLQPFENYFNWTMTYLPESDIHLPYGRIEPLSTSPKTEAERLHIQQSVRSSDANPAKGKKKLVVWMVSNCNARSNRLEYVRHLQKYITVEIISRKGQCGGKDLCPKKENENVCYDIIEQTYKFYLAFENSICREYVTEKFFNAIGRNLVPIVLGGANYSTLAPEHSYINALEYTPRQLATYLLQLDKDDSLYAEYFWWKPYYRVVNLHETNRESFCQLCAALHANPIQEKVASHLHEWYFEESRCVVRPKFNAT